MDRSEIKNKLFDAGDRAAAVADKYDWVIKIAGGLGIIGLLWYFTPVMDLMYAFATVVLVPLTLLCAVGIMSDGTYEGFTKFPEFIREFSEKIKNYAETLRKNPDLLTDKAAA